MKQNLILVLISALILATSLPTFGSIRCDPRSPRPPAGLCATVSARKVAIDLLHLMTFGIPANPWMGKPLASCLKHLTNKYVCGEQQIDSADVISLTRKQSWPRSSARILYLGSGSKVRLYRPPTPVRLPDLFTGEAGYRADFEVDEPGLTARYGSFYFVVFRGSGFEDYILNSGCGWFDGARPPTISLIRRACWNLDSHN